MQVGFMSSAVWTWHFHQWGIAGMMVFLSLAKSLHFLLSLEIKRFKKIDIFFFFSTYDGVCDYSLPGEACCMVICKCGRSL